jgi:hypothetical protein
MIRRAQEGAISMQRSYKTELWDISSVAYLIGGG